MAFSRILARLDAATGRAEPADDLEQCCRRLPEGSYGRPNRQAIAARET